MQYLSSSVMIEQSPLGGRLDLGQELHAPTQGYREYFEQSFNQRYFKENGIKN